MTSGGRVFIRARWGALVTVAVLIAAAVTTNAQDQPVTEQQIKDFTAKLQALQKQTDPIDSKLAEALRSLNTILDQLNEPNLQAVANAAKALTDALSQFEAGDSALSEKNIRDALDRARQVIED